MPGRRLVARLLLLLLAATPAPAAETPCALPARLDDGWEVSTAAEAGFDVEALCAALAGVRSGSANIHAVVVERQGRLVAELYRQGPDRPMTVLWGLWNPFGSDVDFGPTTQHDLRSVSKSVVALLVGIALERGTLASVSTPVVDYFPEQPTLRSPERDAIHLEHLLSMSSGLEWDEGDLPNDETRLYWKWDQDAFVLARPVIAAPGTTFLYNSGGTAVLADVLVRTSGRPLREVARTELFEPLGIADWEWVTDPLGRELAFTGLRMRPRDLVKVGRMALDGGRWRGQQIVPASWIAESFRPRLATGLRTPTGELDYGYQWWLGSVDWHGEPRAWVAAFGNGGQRLFMVPELDLTVVVTAGDYGSPHIGTLIGQVFDQIVSTVRQ